MALQPGGYDIGVTTSRPFSEATIVVHSREPAVAGFGRFLTDVWRERGLLGSFIRKDLKVKYRGSALGVAWTMIRPLVQLMVFGLVLGVFIGFGRSIPQFGFYMFVGIAAFGLFNEALTTSTGSILWGAPLIKKVAFRRELLPLAGVGGAVVNFGFLLVAMAIAYVVTQTHPNWQYLPLLLPAVLIVVVWSVALALLLSACNAFYRDTWFLLEVGLMILFWLTPVVYGWSAVRDSLAGAGLPDQLFTLYMANPMADAVVAMQQALWPGLEQAEAAQAGNQFIYFDSMWAPQLWLSILAGLVAVFIAQRLFARMQEGFATVL